MDTVTLKPAMFRLETEIMDALSVIRDRDGIGGVGTGPPHAPPRISPTRDGCSST